MHGEGGSSARGVVDGDARRVTIDHTPRDRQSETEADAGAAAIGAQRSAVDERMEDALALVRWYPWPLVRHLDADLVLVRVGLDEDDGPDR